MPLTEYMREEAGRAELVGLESAFAGEPASFDIIYTAGRFGIDDSGALKIVMRFAIDMAPPQFEDPDAANYLEVHCSKSIGIKCSYDKKNNIRPWGKTILVELKKGNLSEGEKVYFHFKNFRMQTFVEESFEFKILVDIFATRDFVEIPKSPEITLLAGKPVRYKAVLPSLRRPGESFTLRIKGEDLWGNVSDTADKELHLKSSLPVQKLPERVTLQPGMFSVSCPDLRVSTEGLLSISAYDAETGALLAESNPLLIDSEPAYSRFWGDLHGQSEETIGTNSIDYYFSFARDKAFLDVSCHQGNDFQIDEKLWKRIQEAAKTFNRDGSFVVFPGYEWSGNTGMGGDHNVIYKNEGEPIYHSCHALIQHEAGISPTASTTEELFNSLNGKEVFLYAHVGGRYANIDALEHKPENLAVEIHSSWGTFEWLLHDAFRAGLRPGIVANSDGHKGRPGASYPGAATFGSYGGLTCFLAEELSREGIFDALHRRHHYATSGARIYLDVRSDTSGAGPEEKSPSGAGRKIMGDVFSYDGESLPLTIHVAGTAPIYRVEIYNGREMVWFWRSTEEGLKSKRVRLQWEGAEYRGRGRETVWDGKAVLVNNGVDSLKPFNFWNPEKQAVLVSETEAVWESLTTGGFSGVDLRLKDPSLGALRIETPLVKTTIPVADLAAEERVYHAGGLGRKLSVFSLPEEESANELRLDQNVPLKAGSDNAVYVKVIQEDGFVAWSSPMYVSMQ